jgi:hypothetical protein
MTALETSDILYFHRNESTVPNFVRKDTKMKIESSEETPPPKNNIKSGIVSLVLLYCMLMILCDNVNSL